MMTSCFTIFFRRALQTAVSITAIAVLTSCARPQYLSHPSDGASQKAGAGCIARFANSDLCIEMKWLKMPTETAVGTFVFTTSNAENLLLDPVASQPGSEMKVILWMPSMGHGSAKIAVEALAPGLYRASNVFFSMKGDWEIRFEAGSDKAAYALVF